MNQSGAQAQIQVRTSTENRDWLKQEAHAQERSVNWLINKMFTDARIAAQAREDVQQ